MEKKLIYGCMGLGGSWSHDPLTADDQQHADVALQAAMECGISHFDHADIYTLGKAEAAFGNWYRKAGADRSSVIIQSKAGIRIGVGRNGSNVYDLSRNYLLESVQRSIERLQCEYLDIFLLHRPDPLMDAGEVADTFAEMQERGFVKTFGTSNFPFSVVRSIQHYWKDPMRTHQLQGSLMHDHLIAHLVDAHTRAYQHADGSEGWWGAFLKDTYDWQVWGATDRGRFTGGYRDGMDQQDEAIVVKVRELAASYETSTYAIVLAWLMKLPVSIQPLIGSTDPERIRMSAQSLSVQLSKEDWYDLWLTARNRPLP